MCTVPDDQSLTLTEGYVSIFNYDANASRTVRYCHYAVLDDDLNGQRLRSCAQQRLLGSPERLARSNWALPQLGNFAHNASVSCF
jgi:hypothetical protein